jgi:GTP-binding protein
MAIPQVVIVGRPNVGKSSIFNWLAGHRIAIVDDTAGVTRDRMMHLVQHQERHFEIVDTGGIGINDVDDLSHEIEEQIAIAIDTADIILFIVDTHTGTTSLDEKVARRLNNLEMPVLCVANKSDNANLDPEADQFQKLGRGTLVRVSAKQNRNRDELLDMIVERLPTPQDDDDSLPPEAEMKVAIVGRRNVGKSTFVNSLTETERLIVSEVPGTTRDSVDVRFELDGKTFLAIDTPGLRKGKSIKSDVDFYGSRRAQRSIRRADVVLMFFDAGQRISQVDKQLCSFIADNYKPAIFVVNKWDLMVEHMPTERWADYLRDTFPTMRHAPIAFITGQTGRNIKMTLNHSQMLFKQSHERVGTGQLNRLVQDALEKHPPPLTRRQRRPKIFYATQIATSPPTIVMKCNNPAAFLPDYRRYLLNVLRDHLRFGEIPIKLYMQNRHPDEKS